MVMAGVGLSCLGSPSSDLAEFMDVDCVFKSQSSHSQGRVSDCESRHCASIGSPKARVSTTTATVIIISFLKFYIDAAVSLSFYFEPPWELSGTSLPLSLFLTMLLYASSKSIFVGEIESVWSKEQLLVMIMMLSLPRVVNGAMQGINGTVFAYGVTSSGKTHTMHLKEKYSKLEASRNALRQGVKIQNELIDKLQKESLNFKKELDGGKYSVFDRSVLVSNGVLHDKPKTITRIVDCLLFISLHLFCGIINQLGPDNLDNLRKLQSSSRNKHLVPVQLLHKKMTTTRFQTLWLVRPLKQLQRRES
ncbi:hypothetical protein LOK49_LG02G02249 [Camellia lanceoleosa]|uniref:Uncharacterized protein n=1 Tax=Camellia lanceoleosa TaxID=1840588 RepID=A0ACC0IKD0_9ERIC|nr:hypothetical protein LOK49_LG02G02249 [Camellia lanceoleosa]